MPVWKLFLITLSLSAVSFGGGNTLLAGLERELVQTQVITPAQFQAGVALGQSTPGPLAAFTAAIGRSAGGLWGALFATSALIIVSIAVVLFIRWVPRKWFEQPAVRSGLAAISAYLVAILLFLSYRSVLAGNHGKWIVPAVILGGVVIGRLNKVPTAILMLASLALGMVAQGTPFAGW